MINVIGAYKPESELAKVGFINRINSKLKNTPAFTSGEKVLTSYDLDNLISLYNQPVNSVAQNYHDSISTGKYFRLNPDVYQKQAAAGIYAGANTIVTAPTGTGKTLIAEYAIYKNLAEGKRTFYTSPLKALSNEKYSDFKKIFGAKNVGLMTGDYKDNVNAPIILMTTEIYRNMLLCDDKEKQRKLRDLNTVIFDEFHYMNDKERGTVWEESIMMSPDNVQLIPLSATVDNADKIAKWIEVIHPFKEVNWSLVPSVYNTNSSVVHVNVPSAQRHVPLVYYGYSDEAETPFEPMFKVQLDREALKKDFIEGTLPEKKKQALKDIETVMNCNNRRGFQYNAIDYFMSLSPNQVLYDIDFKENIFDKFNLSDKDKNIVEGALANIAQGGKIVERSSAIEAAPLDDIKENFVETHINLITKLTQREKLPAIDFIFSKAKCEEMSSEFAKQGPNLLSKDEQESLKKVLDAYESAHPIRSTFYNRDILLKGVASHHAGLLPSYKKLVEYLFQNKLIKVVFATETLAAGINMPTKTVIISSLEKPTGEVDEKGLPIKRQLTKTEFQQMAGRAGRRGKDTSGNVIMVNYDAGILKNAVENATGAPDKIESNFMPSYSFISGYFINNHEVNQLNSFIDKSFKAFDKGDSADVKSDFSKYIDLLKDRDFIKVDEKEQYQVTEKGKIASQIRSCNEVFLTELMMGGDLNHLSPDVLASVLSSLVNNKETETEVNPKESFPSAYNVQLDKSKGDVGQELEVLKSTVMKYSDTAQSSKAVAYLKELIQKNSISSDDIDMARGMLFEEISVMNIDINDYELKQGKIEKEIENIKTRQSVIDKITVEIEKEQKRVSNSALTENTYKTVNDVDLNIQAKQQKLNQKLEQLTLQDKQQSLNIKKQQLIHSIISLLEKNNLCVGKLKERIKEARNILKKSDIDKLDQLIKEKDSVEIELSELKKISSEIRELENKKAIIERTFAKIQELTVRKEKLELTQKEALAQNYEQQLSDTLLQIRKYKNLNILKRRVDKIYEAREEIKLLEGKIDTYNQKAKSYNIYIDKFKKIRELAVKIDANQAELGIKKENIKLSKTIAPFILRWCNVDKELAMQEWKLITEELRGKAYFEGDFYRTINNTIDLLNQIRETAENSFFSTENPYMEELSVSAEKAIEMLSKPPIGEVPA